MTPTFCVGVLSALLFFGRCSGSPLAPRAAGECSLEWPATVGETCATMAYGWGISEAAFVSYNPGIDCNDLTPGEWYCVEWSGELPPVTEPTTTHAPTTTARPTTTTTTTTAPTGNGIPTPAPIQPGMTPNCNKFDFVNPGDGCGDIAARNGITLPQFLEWNPAAGGMSCSTLWANSYVCVGIIGSSPTTTITTRATTTTIPGPSVPTPIRSIQTPSPTQPNMVGNCHRFYFVRPGETCATISTYVGVSVSDIVRWNPAVGSSCTGMWAETYVCVGVRSGSFPTYYHHGCYAEPETGRGLSQVSTPRTRAMNVEYCAVFCLLTHGTSLFGVQSSQECRCDTFVSANSLKVADSQCNQNCAGNTAQRCGGSRRYNMYSTSPTPPITYKHHGCAAGTGNRIFGVSSLTSDQMTVEHCANHCHASRGTSKFTVFNRRQCHCGNVPMAGAQWRPDSECNQTCAGNSNQICGSSNRHNVYSNEEVRPVFS